MRRWQTPVRIASAPGDSGMRITASAILAWANSAASLPTGLWAASSGASLKRTRCSPTRPARSSFSCRLFFASDVAAIGLGPQTNTTNGMAAILALTAARRLATSGSRAN